MGNILHEKIGMPEVKIIVASDIVNGYLKEKLKTVHTKTPKAS